MRYSAIIGEGFYNIVLPRRDLAIIDAHFLAASHHRALIHGQDAKFHLCLYEVHLRALFAVVYAGDFSRAKDPTGRGFHLKENWNPARLSMVTDSLLPDPDMFIFMPPDERYGPGEHHPYDLIFSTKKDTLISQIQASA